MKVSKREKKAAAVWETTGTQNLVRNNSSGIYYARFRIGGKLTWRALGTKVLTTAKLKLPDAIKDERKLIAAGDGQITFMQAKKIYLDRLNADPKRKEKTKEYHKQRLKALEDSWPDLDEKKIRSITKDECLKWAHSFAKEFSATNYNHTLGIIREIIEIGIENGARFDNPAKSVDRLTEASAPPVLPSQEQFKAFVATIESSGSGHSRPCANLVRFLAYGGFRLGEAKNITWRDCDFKKGKITVYGGQGGLKGRAAGECRIVPMIPEMRILLENLRSRRSKEAETKKVMQVFECQKAMTSAASKVKMDRITHHDLRHLFATRCIESGVDIPTVSRWLGHKDGGALAMRVYGHLRDQHSNEMAQRVSFSSSLVES